MISSLKKASRFRAGSPFVAFRLSPAENSETSKERSTLCKKGGLLVHVITSTLVAVY